MTVVSITGPLGTGEAKAGPPPAANKLCRWKHRYRSVHKVLAATPVLCYGPAAMQRCAPRFHLGYRPELDGLRAIAVLAVMLGHACLISTGADLRSAQTVPTLLRGGIFGVDMFFVLSGFLITTLLVQERDATGRIGFRAFYTRRALRLLPALALTLLGCMVYVLAFRQNGVTFGLRAVALSGVYISNLIIIREGFTLGMLTPTWSLAVEEQFYTLWPVALIFLSRARSPWALS